MERFAIQLRGMPEKVAVALQNGWHFRVVLPDGSGTRTSIVVSGLTATSFLEGGFDLTLDMCCEEMPLAKNLTGAALLTLDVQADGGLIQTSWMQADAALEVNMASAGLLIYRYVGSASSSLQAEFEATSLILVRRTKVADWTGYKMSELVGKTMREMCYTEV